MFRRTANSRSNLAIAPAVKLARARRCGYSCGSLGFGLAALSDSVPPLCLCAFFSPLAAPCSAFSSAPSAELLVADFSALLPLALEPVVSVVECFP